jgi:hypothetical protein
MSAYTQFLYHLIFGSKDHNAFLSSRNEELTGLLKENNVDFSDEYLFI